VGGEGSIIPRDFLSMEKGEGYQAREAHLPGEEEGMDPKTIVVDIKHDRTVAKGIHTVRIY
jgi:hypothetical protein